MPRKPKPREASTPPTNPKARWLWERLVERELSDDAFAKRISPEKRAHDIQPWLNNTTPLWHSLERIAAALELQFDDVRKAFGYTFPNEVLPQPEPLDPWELTIRRLSWRLEDILRRAPVAAREMVSLTVEGSLGVLSGQIDRLRAPTTRSDAG